MNYGPNTRTVGMVIADVNRRFGDESGVALLNTDIIRWIEEAQTTIVTRNKILKAKSTTVSVAGQGTYSFPSLNIHQIESLHFKGQRIPNMEFSEAEEQIFAADPQRALTGFPRLWYEWAGEFTFWPTPIEVENIDIYYTKKPDPLTGDTEQLLSVTDKYYPDVINFVLKNAYEMSEDWDASVTKAKQFDASIDDQAEEERTAQHMTYPVLTTVDYL